MPCAPSYAASAAAGLHVDLNGDGVPEYVVASGVHIPYYWCPCWGLGGFRLGAQALSILWAHQQGWQLWPTTLVMLPIRSPPHPSHRQQAGGCAGGMAAAHIDPPMAA